MTQSLARLGSLDPHQLGPYRLHGRVGDGSLGVVYLGRGTPQRGARKQLVAVRTLRPELLRDRQLRARLRHTVQSATRVDHPHVARCLGCELDGETPWLATEFVPGPSLSRLVRDFGPLSEPAVRALGGALSGALAALHAQGVTHGDLHPGNVLLAADRPRVVAHDLGLTGGGEGFGGGLARDVFDLGVLLAYAASARHPFRSATPATPPHTPDLTGVPDSLQAILRSCLHRTAEHRPHPRPLTQALDPTQTSGHPAQEWLPEPYLWEIESWEETVRQRGGRRFLGRG